MLEIRTYVKTWEAKMTTHQPTHLPSTKAMPEENKRQRVSHSMPKLEGLERTYAKDAVLEQLASGKISQGQALKQLRVQVLGLKQMQFANMVRVSRKTLSDIENDKGNYSINTLNQIFRPFGLKVGLVQI